MITFNYLMTQALIILNARLKKENTAKRVGGLFRDLLLFLQNLVLGMILKGELANEAAIKAISNPTKGDTYKALDTGHYWCYDGSKWNDIGELIPSDIEPRLLHFKSYNNPILPIIQDQEDKILFAWNKDENTPIIPNLIRSLIGLINYESLDQNLKYKLNDIDVLNSLVSLISKENWLIAALDTDNKIIWGIDRDKRMFLAGQEIISNEYYGYIFETDSEWIIRYTDKDNKIIWGIDRDFKIFPTDNRITDIQINVDSLSEKNATLELRVDNLENSSIKDSSIILDVNYKGYFNSLDFLLKEYPLKEIAYVLDSTLFRPTLLEHQTTITGNSDQRQWYSNVGGYFAYTRWNGIAYEWYLSDTIFQNKPTLGIKIAVYNGSSLDSFIDEIKQAYLTNSVTIRTTPSAIIAFEPDLLIYPNCGFAELKAGRTLTQYIGVLDLDLNQYLNKIPQTSIVLYSAPNINTDYRTWLSDIEAKCEEFSVKFVNLNNQSGINNINKNTFLLDDATLNNIGSKRIAYRSLIEGESTERVNYSNKQPIPVIYIDTENGAFFDGKPKSTKMKMTRFEVDVRDSGLKGFEGTLVPDKDEIRGRGNTTWDMPKKPYRLKFDKKVSFFGNAPEKNWVLLALYFDKSSIRPSLAHRIGHYINDYRLVNNESIWYCPTEQLVEVVVNGRYEGLYCFTDHVSKVTRSRVNIPEPTPEDIATLNESLGHYVLNSNIEIPVSGGFLIELEQNGRALNQMGKPIVDKNNIVTGDTGNVFIQTDYGTELRYFGCNSLQFFKKDLVTAKAPNGIVLEAYTNYIKKFISYVNSVLTGNVGKINGKTYKERISEYIDINTFIDYFFIMEIYKNPDSRDFSSIYYYKDRDKLVNNQVVISQLKACPIWDIDLGAGNSREIPSMQNPEGWFIKGNVWITAMLRDSEVKQMYVDRWNALNIGSVWSKIMDELVTKSFDSALRDNERWGNNTLSYFEMTLAGFTPTKSKYYELELSYLRLWLQTRINWINNNINNL